jgi:predicted outer membrane repeat protein
MREKMRLQVGHQNGHVNLSSSLGKIWFLGASLLFLFLYASLLSPALLRAEQSCCGRTMPSGVTNPFSCFGSGNCVWWAVYKRNDLNFMIHSPDSVEYPNYWVKTARDHGYTVGSTPREGAIVVYPRSSTWGSYGHVAFVESVSGSQYTVTEMGYNEWTCVRRRTRTAGQYNESYIYEKGSGSSKPDLVVREIYLTDHKTSFFTGEAFRIYARTKNVGDADIDHDIRIRYYRSTGKKIDNNPTSLGTDDIQKENLEEGESHWEDKGTTAPSTPGTYNITVKADCDKEVDEEHESNNWYDPPLVFEVLPVTPPNWSIVNQEGDPKVYLFYNGKKWWILNQDIMFALGFSWEQLLTYPAANLDQYANGQDIVSDGLLGQLGSNIYLFEAGQWHYLPDWAYMDCRGGQHPENVLAITQALFDMYGEGAAVTPCNNLPEGWLDSATCDEINGWARDPDTTSPIRVHLYADGPAGQGTIIANELADLYRSDLPFADKNHGYSIPTPSNIKDGQSHTIYVYAIDSGGGNNPLLNNSPQSISCSPPPPPPGSLKVTINPQGAVDAGAQWNVDSGPWQSSGVTVSGLSVGDHTVNFKSIPGWGAPDSVAVTISSGQTTQIMRSYVPLELYVAPPPIGDNGNDGFRPDLPFATIQYAIDMAQGSEEYPVIIHVAAGVYYENIEMDSLDNWKSIEGGWNSDFSQRWDFDNEGLEPNAEYRTIIDGGGNGSCIKLIDINDRMIIDGITIQHGNADSGGGISCNSASSPIINNCVFSENTSVHGGGICAHGNPIITRCTFVKNQANHGGGIYIDECSPTITDCVFSENMSDVGGGIDNGFHSTPAITNCIFNNNQAMLAGGGIAESHSHSTITNCTFEQNQTMGKGGGIYISESAPIITNCILWNNSASNSGSDIYLYGSESPIIKYCDIEQDDFAGVNGNIKADPLFVDPENGDFHLQQGSPCIDAGDPVETLTADYIEGLDVYVDLVTAISAGNTIWITDGLNTESDEVISTTDTTITLAKGFSNSYLVADGAYVFTESSNFLSEPEPNGNRINMGAYGGTTSSSPSSPPGDANGDGSINVQDVICIINVILDTGTASGSPDCNNDGKVNVQDVICVINKILGG